MGRGRAVRDRARLPVLLGADDDVQADLDLYNQQSRSPTPTTTTQGHAHWDFWNYMTFHHVTFLFKHTVVPDLALEHVRSSASPSSRSRSSSPCRPATRSRASPDRWGQSAGVGIFLVYLVPPTLLFLPLSRLIAELNLQDTLWAMILVYPSFTIPFATWLLMGFFKTIPQELEDAALVDGCSRLQRAAARSSSPCPGAGDPDRRDLRLLALRERVHLRVHLHVSRRASARSRPASRTS